MKQVTVTWNWEDISELRPDWTEEACQEMLVKMSKVLQERCIEEGWYIVRDLLSIYENEAK